LSFVLRQISRRNGAPDIVRTRALAAAEPVIGRGSDCDIQLTDLAVSLRHAVLRQTAPGRVLVEALGTEHFEANDEFVSRAELNLAQSPRLNFGHHLLTLEKGEKDGDVLVVLTEQDNPASHAAASDQKAAFSLKGALFSQRRTAWIVSLVILALCLALPIGAYLMSRNQQRTVATAAVGQWSSGPLSPGHHFLENNCAACHQQAFVPVRDTACLSCHQAGLNRIESARLSLATKKLGSPFAPDPAPDHAPRDRLERAMPPDPNIGRRINKWIAATFSHPSNGCASCHTEHIGSGKAAAEKQPVTQDQIRRNDCADCHTGLKQRLPDTMIPDAPDWGRHPDFRALVVAGFDGAKPRMARVSLPGGEKSGLKFTHALHLKADGGVQRMAQDLGKAQGYGAQLTCASCHRSDDRGGFVGIEMERDCAACHSLAFARSSGVVQTLPHGEPDKVVAALQTFYAAEPAAPESFARRPGLRGVSRAAPTAERVAGSVRAAFSSGGTCFTCHSVVPPAVPGALSFGIAPVKLTNRYLPFGAFNHNVPEHREDEKGAATCAGCHKAESSAHAEDLILPRIATCSACHGKTRAQTAIPAGADCAGCHGFHSPGQPVTGRRKELARYMLIRTR
jgi:cytochrome c1